MAIPTQHRILIATDGSHAAKAALTTAVRFPWPESSCMRAVIAKDRWFSYESNWLAEHAEARSALGDVFEQVAEATGLAMALRWPNSDVVIVDEPPKVAILVEAARFKASVIVLGWRGHGRFRRFLAGSVSRSIAEHAQCPVLVAREAPKALRRFVLGFEDCINADRAIDFLKTLTPGPRSSVVLVHVVDPIHMPLSVARFPSSIRAPIRREVSAIKAQRRVQGKALLEAAAARLEGLQWRVECEVRVGDPLACLLEAIDEHRADALILGARAISGVERVLLGSVANGALDRSPAPVLLVR